jgi:hypothetical protein
MKARISPSALGWTLALALATGAAPGLAQTDEQRVAARSLATEGATAFKEGRFKDSAELFTKAESLVHAPPHLLFLARSNVQLGRFVKAREAYLKIIKEQLPPNAPEAFVEAQTAASAELPGIQPKIAKLTIKVVGAESVKDLTLTVDGDPIPAVMVGIAQPMDPGDHTVTVTATGMRADPARVSLHDAEQSEVTLTLVVDPNAAAAPPGGSAPGAGAAGAPVPASGEGASTAGDTAKSGSSGMKIGAYVGFGVGALGLGLGTVFLLSSSSKRGQAQDLCTSEAQKAGLPSGQCPDTVQSRWNSLNSDAKSAGTISAIGFALGGVGIATGVTLLVLSGKTNTEQAGIHPWIGWNSAGAFGRF